MADSMEIDATKTDGVCTAMDAVASKNRREANAKVLPAKEARAFINNRSSNAEGFKQLFFHIGFFAIGAYLVAQSRTTDSWTALILSELFLGFQASFYFAGFHEMIHNTAFKDRAVNKFFAHVVGFLVFRGANWYWYFHWNHHRYTNDPQRDPELSGTTVDRADPTLTQGVISKLLAYGLFLSGYPFGFERLPGVFRYALGGNSDLPEIWVDTQEKRKNVQMEYIFFTLGYGLTAVAAVTTPATWGANLWYYWILPHMLGAGHLRYYQTAEHRACRLGSYTDTSAWITSRTSTTFWVYSRLAWNMPYHSEHHAWPNVPFHVLPEVHKKIKDLGTRPRSKCNPGGEDGYLSMHWILLKDMLSGGSETVERSEDKKVN